MLKRVISADNDDGGALIVNAESGGNGFVQEVGPVGGLFGFCH